MHTTVWLPDRRILLTTMPWSSPLQLYSVRGDVFRDPREWIAGLKFNHDLELEVLISPAARPVVGKEAVRKRLEGYLDGASFVLDQTLHGILRGKGPDELRHLVRLPDYLRAVPNNRESCGEVSSYPPAIFFAEGASAELRVRRAVAEFIEDPAAYPRKPGIVMKLSSATWARVYLSAAPVEELIKRGDITVTAGDAADAARVLNLWSVGRRSIGVAGPGSHVGRDRCG